MGNIFIMDKRTQVILILVLLIIGFSFQAAPCRAAESIELDRPAGYYQKSYSPADGSTVSLNPPPFIWLPPQKGLSYILEISLSPDCSSPAHRIADIPVSTYALGTTLKPGKWYWRYGVKAENSVRFSKVRSFIVPENAGKWPYPDMDELISSIPRERPRLFILKNELDSFRQRAKDGDLKELCRSILRSCDRHIGEKLVEEPPYVTGQGPERGKNYQRIFRTTRPPMDLMERCALAYLLTGDKKYGTEAKRRILHFFSWNPEGSTSYRNNDEPAMWVMMRGTRAYDWTYDLFSPDERKRVESVMRIRAGQFYDHLMNRRRFHTNPYESHAGRTLGFLGEAALSFGNEWPEAEEWLNYVLTLFRNIYPAWGKDDGGWHEGPSYWSYYMDFALHFAVPLREATGVDLMKKPFFRNTPYYKLYTNPPYAKISPFGDGEHRGPSRSMGQLMYHFSTLLQDPHLRWYADEMKAGPGAGILGIFLKDDKLVSKPPDELPSSRYFPGVGLVSLHTDLGDVENDVHFLIHSDPYGAISHAHADQNAFTLEAYGEALAIASGYYPWYGSNHHKNWQWESKSSNTITFDGGIGQKIRDPASKGKIVRFVSEDGYDYVVADASAAYRGRLTKFIRRVVRSGETFVICDEVSAPKAVQLEWNLHALSEMNLDTEEQKLSISQGDARLRVQFLHPAGLRMEQIKGFEDPPEYGEPDQYHAVISTPQKQEAAVFLTVLIPYRKNETEKLPKTITGTVEEGGVLVSIFYENVKKLIAINTDPNLKKIRLGPIELVDRDVIIRE